MVTDDENNILDDSAVLVDTNFDYDELIGEAVIVNIGGVLVCKEYNIAEDGINITDIIDSYKRRK